MVRLREGCFAMKWVYSVGRASVVARMTLVLFASALLQSCVPQPGTQPVPATPISNITHIKIDGVEYPTVDAALAARKRDQDAIVAQLGSEADPIKGRVLIVLPDHDRLRPLVAQQTALQLKRVVTGDALDFLIDQARQNLHEQSDALVKNGAFQSATIEERNDVLDPAATDADFVVWYQVRTVLPNNTGAWIGVWLVRRVGSNATLGASVDPGTPVGAPRIASFIKSVRDDALRLGGTTVGGATAARLPATMGAPGITGVTTGSGIVVNKQGDIVTNAHVVAACSDPTVIDTDNVRYHAHVVTKDEANDLALVKADHHWPQAASFREGSELRPGDSVVVSGFPLTGLVASSMAVTVGAVSATAGPRDDSRMFQLSAPVQPGNSGGPVLDDGGHVVGVVTAVLNGTLLTIATGISPQNVNFAIKSAIVGNFLDAENVAFTRAPSTQELSAGTVGELARKFTVRIQCGG